MDDAAVDTMSGCEDEGGWIGATVRFDDHDEDFTVISMFPRLPGHRTEHRQHYRCASHVNGRGFVVANPGDWTLVRKVRDTAKDGGQ